jgi:hypothetical protein
MHIHHIDMVILNIDMGYGIWDIDMGDANIDTVLLDIDMGYLVNLTTETSGWPWGEGYQYGNFDCRLAVNTQASQGHSCNLHTDIDYKGHDMIFGHGGSDAAKAGPHTRIFFGSIHASTCP